MGVTIVRYTTKPERADENQALIEKVFVELDAARPTPAFVEFVRDIADRCVEGPVASDATLVGSYQCSTDAGTDR